MVKRLLFSFTLRQPFSAPAERGTRTASACSPLTGGSLFQHWLSGAYELPQAGLPLTGGGFSLNLSGGIRRAPRRGKRVDTKVSTLLTPTSFGGGSGADYRHVTAAKRSTAEDFFYRRGAQCAPMPRHIRSVR